MTVSQKIDAVRTLLSKYRLDALIVPTSDPHQSEYVAAHWKDREYLSGFTGSAGLLVVTKDSAGLWTDSRYFLQAEKELKGSPILMHKLVDQFAPEYIDWLIAELGNRGTVAIDSSDFSQSQYQTLKRYLKDTNIAIDTSQDLVSEVWLDRPPLSQEVARIHDTRFSGLSVSEKLELVRAKMEEEDETQFLLTALDDIAWLFNIRGNDVEYNPVVVSFAFIGRDEAILFIDHQKIDPKLTQHFIQAGVTMLPYSEIYKFLNLLPETSRLLLDPSECNAKMYQAVNAVIAESVSIVKHLKAVKNETELINLHNAMVKDGVALANSFFWLEQTLGKEEVSEAQFAAKIAHFRSLQEGYKGESFAAIIGYKGNGAIIHYHPSLEGSRLILKEGILLCDSGGQYDDGTTDITRTIALSKPSEEQKRHFTLVLKGHIALNLVTFPKGTTGVQLDILARQYLWENGLNYLHGTGHGVGFHLNVHEGPQGIAGLNSEKGKAVMKAGMLTSNEPGLYLEGQYGIRIENLIVTVEDSKHDGFLSHKVVTLYPLDHELIDEKLLTSREKAWINTYHQNAYEAISPFLPDDIKTWFKYQCRGFN